MRFKGVKPSKLKQSLLTKLRGPEGGAKLTHACTAQPSMHAQTMISTYTIHVHSSAKTYGLAALPIWILKNRHHKRRWPRETGTRRRVILDLPLDLNNLQKKLSPLSRKSSATSGITHHQVLPTNQQKVRGHHQSVQSLPSGGRTIPPPLTNTQANMPCPSAGAPWHLTRHTCNVASTPCQHRCRGHHVAVTKVFTRALNP